MHSFAIMALLHRRPRLPIMALLHRRPRLPSPAILDAPTDGLAGPSRCAGLKPAIKRRFLARLATAALSLPQQHGGGGDVLALEDPSEPLDSVAVGHRLREWHCARSGPPAPLPTEKPARLLQSREADPAR